MIQPLSLEESMQEMAPTLDALDVIRDAAANGVSASLSPDGARRLARYIEELREAYDGLWRRQEESYQWGKAARLEADALRKELAARPRAGEGA